MDRQLYFNEMPTVLDWGTKKIVPLNVAEEVTFVDGEEVIGYRADIVTKVEAPVSLDSILDAAIASEYSSTELKSIMRNIGDASNAEVAAYTEFTDYVKDAATEAGYE